MTKKHIFEKLRKTVVELSSKTDEAGELYKSLFEDSHSAMLITNPETGDILDANFSACKYYQYTKQKITSMNIMDINLLASEQVRAEMQNAKTEKRNYFNFQHKLANGEIRDVEVYSSPIMLAEQKVLYSIIHDISQRKANEKERERLIAKLEKVLNELKVLKGILPLCSFCKKIRDEKGVWKQVDVYIHDHSEADISHTVCPECIRKHYPEFR